MYLFLFYNVLFIISANNVLLNKAQNSSVNFYNKATTVLVLQVIQKWLTDKIGYSEIKFYCHWYIEATSWSLWSLIMSGEMYVNCYDLQEE